jgi:hypothetical protein
VKFYKFQYSLKDKDVYFVKVSSSKDIIIIKDILKKRVLKLKI